MFTNVILFDKIFLERSGFESKEDFREYLELDYKRNKYYEEYMLGSITDDEVNSYYNDNVFGTINTEHILVQSEKSNAEEKAQEILDKLKNGASWGDLKNEYKNDIITEVVPIDFDSNLESAYKTEAENLKNESYSSSLVKTAYGYHIVYRIKNDEKAILANEELKNVLGLDKLDRIELFDNSNLFGSYNVSGMVVFIDGKPAKNEYRKYKISVDKNDDYGTMREVIYRRYFRVLKDNLTRPDLIIVDGGLGQMHIAKEVIDSLNMDINIVGLKKDDKHSTNALLTFDKEIEIEKRSNLFHYLERMQDEVHNYTINYHKQIRSKGLYASILDSIEGIGNKRKQQLLKKFKTVENLKKQDLEQLQTILPEKVAINLKSILDNLDKI